MVVEDEKSLRLPEIDPAEFSCGAFRVWGDDWLLLAAGDFEHGNYNAMTVGWGFFGTLWAVPAVMVMVRPQRYTLEFLKEYPRFTLSAFPAEFRPALGLIGKHSGREMPDKIERAGLTPVPARFATAPAFLQSELLLECRTLYQDELSGRNFQDKSIIGKMYPERDYHICFYAEVERIAGTEKYSAR